MAAREPVVGGSAVPRPDISTRAFPSLATPAGSGPLLLAGGTPSAAVLDRLVTASGSGSQIVVLAAGYAKAEIATKDAKAHAASLEAMGASATWLLLNAKTKSIDVTAALAAADGVLLTAPDPATVLASLAGAPAVTTAIKDAWLGGAALLANDAAASALSSAFTADARPGNTTGQIESAAIREFRPDSVTPVAGLGWVHVAIEPGIVSNRHWGRLYNLVAAQPATDRLAFGVDAGTAVEFRSTLARPLVVGDSAAVALDGRSGSFGVGSNGALAAHWILLDSFVGGEEIAP